MTGPGRPGGAVGSRRSLPLALWAAGAATGAGLLFLVSVTAGLALTHGLHRRVLVAALGLGGVATAVVAVLAGLVAQRMAAGLAALRAAAERSLAEPGALSPGPLPPVASTRWAVAASSEVARLAELLSACRTRIRLADEAVEQGRRSAQTASAGMFALLSGLVAAEEGARGQLAAELHDTVAQSMARARAALADRRPEQAADLLAEAEEQVRGVMARARPAALRDGDLAQAMALMRADLGHRYGLAVVLDWPEQPQPLPLAIAVTVYRFFQECLLNVAKHSDVDEARATLSVTDDALCAQVYDAGCGFDPSAVRPVDGRHVGLDLLRERARLAGGSLQVQSLPGQGVTVRLRLPLTAVPRPSRPVGRAGSARPAPGLVPVSRAGGATQPPRGRPAANRP